MSELNFSFSMNYRLATQQAELADQDAMLLERFSCAPLQDDLLPPNVHSLDHIRVGRQQSLRIFALYIIY
jgi:hypothetical protein